MLRSPSFRHLHCENAQCCHGTRSRSQQSKTLALHIGHQVPQQSQEQQIWVSHHSQQSTRPHPRNVQTTRPGLTTPSPPQLCHCTLTKFQAFFHSQICCCLFLCLHLCLCLSCPLSVVFCPSLSDSFSVSLSCSLSLSLLSVSL